MNYYKNNFNDLWSSYEKELKQNLNYKKNVIPEIIKKYLSYSDVEYRIVPYLAKLKKEEKYTIVNRMNRLIKYQDLLRSEVYKDKDSYELKTFQPCTITDMPWFYILEDSEIEQLINDCISNLISKGVINEIPYRFFFVEKETEVYLFFISNHIIFDGHFEFERYLNTDEYFEELDDYTEYAKYIENVKSNFSINSLTSKNSSKYVHIVNEFSNFSKKTKKLKFEIDTRDLLKNSKSIQHPIVESIYYTLKSCLKCEELPLSVLDNGRDFNDRDKNFIQFGDFHDAKQFVVNDKNINSTYLEIDRTYKENRFLSLIEIDMIKNPSQILHDPIVVNIEYYIPTKKSNLENLFQEIVYKHNKGKKYFIKIRVLCDLFKFKYYISVKYNSSLHNKLYDFEKIMKNKLCEITNRK